MNGGAARTLARKVWDGHVVERGEDGRDLLYVDLHLIHEVTSPQAFTGLRAARRTVRRPRQTVATMDHSVPTRGGYGGDHAAAAQTGALRANAAEFGIPLYPLGHARQGIVHVIGPQLGLTLPGMTIVCGDSHTATHGAFGALAFGIGTSEVEHVLATQTLAQSRPQTMSVEVRGALPADATAKDLILGIVGALGTQGGVGAVVEYRGAAVRALSMEARMTVCNMTIEAGARAGMIAPDETTFAFLAGLRYSPAGEAWDEALAAWRALCTDPGAAFDRSLTVDAAAIRPFVTWGTNPSEIVSIDGAVPDPEGIADPTARQHAHRALAYMGLRPGTPMRDIPVDTVFIGSCTNGRLEDLRAAAAVVAGRRVHRNVRRALVVPGSMDVKARAEAEGLDRVFADAGFEWHAAGCSMCVGMNGDALGRGQRSASTSNRNFEGRQGDGGRTHLVSPPVAAATAISGTFAAPADLR